MVDGDDAQHWDYRSRLKVRLDLAEALISLGLLTGDPEHFLEAVSVSRNALKDCSKEVEPKTWALARLELARTILQPVDEHSDEELSEASQALRDALGETTEPQLRLLEEFLLNQALMLRAARAYQSGRTNESQQLASESLQVSKEVNSASPRAPGSAVNQEEPSAKVIPPFVGLLSSVATTIATAKPVADEQELADFEAALKEIDPQTDPVTWAVGQVTLGAGYVLLGLKHQDDAQLEEARAAFQQALSVETEACTPVLWATTQDAMGMTLHELAKRPGNSALLKDATQSYREAIRVFTNRRYPSKWAEIQVKLGTTLRQRGLVEHNPKLLCEALHRQLVCRTVDAKCPTSAEEEAVMDAVALGSYDKKTREECGYELGSAFWLHLKMPKYQVDKPYELRPPLTKQEKEAVRALMNEPGLTEEELKGFEKLINE